MEEPFSAPSPNPRFPSPEDYLAEVDDFVQSVQTAGKSRPADAQMLQALLAQAELYLKAGRSEVAATAYERLLVIMRHFEGITPLAVPLVDGRSDPGTASERLEATAPRQRIVHVERRRIRPYRSPDADTSNPPVVDEIQRPPAPTGFRVSAAIPTSRGQPFWRRLLPLVVVVVLLAAAWLAFVNRNSLRAVASLAGVKPPTASVAALLPAASATLALPVRAPLASQAPTRAVLTATAPGVTATVVVTPTVVLAPTVTPTSTPSPTVTDTPSPTSTPSATVTPTPTSTDTPSPTPTIIFTGPDPLAGATQLLFEEDFNPKTYYWLVGETTFGRSSITPGGLDITTKTPHTIAWVFGGVPVGQNFFELATVTTGACDTDDRVGLVLRAETDSNLLLFGVTCDGRYRLQEVQGATEHLLVLPTPSDVIQTGPGAVNELGVRADGNQISLYINRQFLTRVATTDLSKGRFGVFVNSTTTTNLTATFGRIRAWVIAP